MGTENPKTGILVNFVQSRTGAGNDIPCTFRSFILRFRVPLLSQKLKMNDILTKRAPLGAPLVLLLGSYCFSNVNCMSQDSRISSMSRRTATLSSGRKMSLCDRPACAHRVTSRISYSKPLTSGGHSTV